MNDFLETWVITVPERDVVTGKWEAGEDLIEDY